MIGRADVHRMGNRKGLGGHVDARSKHGWLRTIWPLPILTITAAVVGLGCRDNEHRDVVPSSATTGSAMQVSPLATEAPVQQGPHHTRFKVTNARPNEVEPMLRNGWTLVNCSFASKSSSAMQYGVYILGGEHCYFVGDERSEEPDGGAGADAAK